MTDPAKLWPLGEGHGEAGVGRSGEPRAFVGNVLMFHPPGHSEADSPVHSRKNQFGQIASQLMVKTQNQVKYLFSWRF